MFYTYFSNYHDHKIIFIEFKIKNYRNFLYLVFSCIEIMTTHYYLKYILKKLYYLKINSDINIKVDLFYFQHIISILINGYKLSNYKDKYSKHRKIQEYIIFNIKGKQETTFFRYFNKY